MFEKYGKPMGNWLELQAEEAVATTAGGIVIPQTAQKLPTLYKVLRAGGGLKNGLNGELIDTTVKEGFTVLINPHAITKIRVWRKGHEETLLLLNEGEVLKYYTAEEMKEIEELEAKEELDVKA